MFDKGLRRRQVRETLLVVAEGDAEVALLRCVKSLYTRDSNGRSITIRNASGKGARYVIDYAARLRAFAPYTESAAVCDSDTDWNQDTAAFAKRSSITVLLSEPCLERSLLAIAGEQVQGNTAKMKQMFEAKFGGPAHQPGLIEEHFTLNMFNAARGNVEVLHRLLTAMRV